MVLEEADISDRRVVGGYICAPSTVRIRCIRAPGRHIEGPGQETSMMKKVAILLIFFILEAPPALGEEIFASDWSGMGNAQAGRGDFREAVKSYDRAIALDAYNPDIWYNRGLALTGLGEYEEALRSYQRATNLKPFDPDLWLSRGAVLSTLGRYEEALDSYDRATEFGSQNPDAWNNRGTVLARLGRNQEAIESFDRAIKIRPGDADAWKNRGTVLAALGRFEEAIGSYERAIEIRPGDADAWNNKGSALHRLGRYQEAVECYDRAIGLDPLHRYAWHNKGILVPTLDEKTEKAFALLRKRIYVETDMVSLHLQEGNAPLTKAGDGAAGGRLSGWRDPLVMAAMLVAGLLLNLGGKGRAFKRSSFLSSLSRLILIGNRSLRRRSL